MITGLRRAWFLPGAGGLGLRASGGVASLVHDHRITEALVLARRWGSWLKGVRRCCQPRARRGHLVGCGLGPGERSSCDPPTGPSANASLPGLCTGARRSDDRAGTFVCFRLYVTSVSGEVRVDGLSSYNGDEEWEDNWDQLTPCLKYVYEYG